MTRELPTLRGFEDYVLAQVEQAGDRGVVQADLFRHWIRVASRSTLQYRIERLAIRGKIRIENVGRTILLLPAIKTEETEEEVAVE